MNFIFELYINFGIFTGEKYKENLTHRHRKILAYPRGGGAPCPHLRETKPCGGNGGCKRWQTGKWSDCFKVPESDTGISVRGGFQGPLTPSVG